MFEDLSLHDCIHAFINGKLFGGLQYETFLWPGNSAPGSGLDPVCYSSLK